MAWLGVAWLGVAWLGVAWLGLAWLGLTGIDWVVLGVTWRVELGVTWRVDVAVEAGSVAPPCPPPTPPLCRLRLSGFVNCFVNGGLRGWRGTTIELPKLFASASSVTFDGASPEGEG